VQTATSHTQAGQSTFLPFRAHQQDQVNLPCHRAFLCTSPQRSVPPSTPCCHYWGDRQRVLWGFLRRNPRTSALEHALQESRATGKQQLLLGDSGNLRKHLMKSGRGRNQVIRENLTRCNCLCSWTGRQALPCGFTSRWKQRCPRLSQSRSYLPKRRTGADSGS